MRTKFLVLVFTGLIISFGCSEKQKNVSLKNEIKDDLGIVLSLDTIPQKIIALAPNLTELIYYLKLDHKLVGNTLYCNYPPEAQRIEKVGDMLTFNFEKIVKIKPDLIFISVEGNTKETYDKFKELGLKIFVTNPRNYNGIKKTTIDFGKIFKIENDVNKITAEWDSTINHIQSNSKIHVRETAMYAVELKPLMLSGTNTFINEYLKLCNLKNIAEDSPMNYPLFSREEILKRDPDYIILPTDGGKDIANFQLLYPEWKNLKAVKNNNVIFVDRDLYSRPGPRFAEAANDLFIRIQNRRAGRH